MRVTGCLLALVCVTGGVRAQTNISPNAASSVRYVTLMDCIQSALEKNLTLRVSRYSVPQARLSLMSAYAGYDPTFGINGQHTLTVSGGGRDPSTQLSLPNSTINANSFNMSLLNGLTPFGTTYNLRGSVSESYGTTTFGTNTSPTDTSRGSATINLTQPLLKNFWIDSTRLSVRISKLNITDSELGVTNSTMAAVAQVEQAYYRLIAAREAVVAQQKALQAAEELVAQNRKKVEVGAMAPLDERLAESQSAASRANLIQAQQSMVLQLNALKALISDDFARWANLDLVPIDPLVTNRQYFILQNSWNNAMTKRPDVLQARIAVERQGIQLKYNFNQLFPELDLVGSYGHNASGTREFSQALDVVRAGSTPTYSYGAQLTIPLANIAARAAYRSAKLTKEQLLLGLKSTEENALVDVHNAIGTVNANFDSVDATRKAREYAEEALEAEQKKLEQGKSTTYTVLQMQRDLTSARNAEIAALANYNIALSLLSVSEGTILDRLRIDVQIAPGPLGYMPEDVFLPYSPGR